MLFAATLSVSAQKRASQKPKAPEWIDNPTTHPVPPEYVNEPAYFILNDVDLDYRYEGRTTNVYYTHHYMVKVLDEKGIRSFNNIGITVNGDTRVPLIKARAILPNGKVNDVQKDMIKVTKDAYGRNKIVFAFEGVEKNTEIEVLVKEITPFSAFGSIPFQYTIPVQNCRFELSTPKDLVFEAKGHNGFPGSRDTLLNNRRHISLAVSDIPALDEEPNSFYDLHNMRVDYRLQYNAKDDEKKKLNTWNDLGRRLYDRNYNLTNKEKATINKYLSSLGVAGSGSELENIKKIENGIKNDIVLYSYVDESKADALDSIINKKVATESGYIRLFVACLTQAGVKHELGVTSDRTTHKVESNFENWAVLDDYLIYFPNLKQFLAPTRVNYRYPVIPVENTSNKGVFCTIPPNGVITGGLAELITIPALPAKENCQKIAAGVTFSKEMEPQVDINYAYTGYTSTSLRNAIITDPSYREKETVLRLVPLADKRDNIVKFTTANERFDNYYSNKPLEITATVNAPELVEQAGPKYLFKVGAILGDQQNLYDKPNRTMPVDLAYPHSFSRTITINIPQGYKITNPEALRMHADYVDKNVKPIISFSSNYVLKTDKKNGDKLIVYVNENYSQIHFSPSEYEQYRKVVNTAADFNKVTLLMEKKRG